MTTREDNGAQDGVRAMELNDAELRPLHYRKILWRLLNYLLPYRRQVTLASAAILVYSGTVVALPWLVARNRCTSAM